VALRFAQSHKNNNRFFSYFELLKFIRMQKQVSSNMVETCFYIDNSKFELVFLIDPKNMSEIQFANKNYQRSKTAVRFLI